MKRSLAIFRFLRSHWLTVFGIAMIILGVACGYKPFAENFFNKQPAGITFNTPKTATAKQADANITAGITAGHPTRLQIPSLGFDLPIIDGYYNKQTQTWNLSKDKVQYATNTPEPNTSAGNTFLYGHNRREVFEFLYKITPGAQANITTSNGHVFTYTYVGSTTTNPYDDSLFKYQGPPILTIQTCSGPTYQYRQLFTFSLASVK